MGVPTSVQIFDLDHLRAQTAGDPVLQREILALFLQQSTEILALLQDDTALPRARADLAHKLIGSARAVGAFQLADAAEAVETRLRAAQPPQGALAELAAAADRTDAEIRQYLALPQDSR
jgi:HPt (histidine-containing phosphotransfer) domain-containing protein